MTWRRPLSPPFRRVGYAVRAVNTITLRVTGLPAIDGLYRVDDAQALRDGREVPVVSADRGRVGTAALDRSRRACTFGVAHRTVPFEFVLTTPLGGFERLMHAGLERAPLTVRQADLVEFRAAQREDERRRNGRGEPGAGEARPGAA